VICFDEWGPLELRPLPGVTLARAGHPRRQRATYRRTQGTEQFLGFYDVHGDCLMGTCRRRKTARDVLAAFRRLRTATRAVGACMWSWTTSTRIGIRGCARFTGPIGSPSCRSLPTPVG